MVQGGKYVCGSLVGNNSNRLELVSTELELPFAGSAHVEVMCYCTEKCTTHHTACPFIHCLQYCDLQGKRDSTHWCVRTCKEIFIQTAVVYSPNDQHRIIM